MQHVGTKMGVVKAERVVLSSGRALFGVDMHSMMSAVGFQTSSREELLLDSLRGALEAKNYPWVSG